MPDSPTAAARAFVKDMRLFVPRECNQARRDCSPSVQRPNAVQSAQAKKLRLSDAHEMFLRMKDHVRRSTAGRDRMKPRKKHEFIAEICIRKVSSPDFLTETSTRVVGWDIAKTKKPRPWEPGGAK